MDYSKHHNIICFKRDELLRLFKEAKIQELNKEIAEEFDSSTKSSLTKQRLEKITEKLSEIGANDRDEHEIFFALFIMLEFYDEDAEVCFELSKPINPLKEIQTLEELNKHRNGTLTDFLIRTKQGFRKFQLKRYRKELSSDSIISFVEKTIKSYGTLNDVNLLVLLQPEYNQITDINLASIHGGLKKFGYTFEGEILIAHNENNEKSIISQVYPDLKSLEVPIILPSKR